MVVTQEYMDDLMVRMAHHSTAIEGNTLSQGETKSILIDNYIPRAMNLRELHEVSNYKQFMPYMLRAVQKHEPITTNMIRNIHRLLCNNAIEGMIGEFKIIQNMVIGADFMPTPPYMVQSMLHNWILDLDEQLRHAADARDVVQTICRQHLQFERIHPFSDGNGRVGRALMVLTAFQNKIPPINIPKESREPYMAFLNTMDIEGFTTFAMRLLDKEYERMSLFQTSKTALFSVSDRNRFIE